ncbi:hypothetical protein ATO10_05167 [Actibacterium atlanticum]|uniref:DUF3108 domain-containing protein n=1 Tax=Actibacterium atlanticum TaxID=1461693 RepID=A0A058ZN40_9RHOB|nr:hypothetical protein [Actibacterium atlanticum]KCV82973.1 hypothetical protein ATO10_05167 [Actibacterium atlanticum]
MTLHFLRSFFGALAFVAVVSHPAAAGAADFAKPGTRITWSWSALSSDGTREKGTNTVQAASSRGHVGKYKRKGESKTRNFVPACWVCGGDSYNYDKKAYAELWPLETGKTVQVTLKRKKDGRVRVSTITVGKLQKVKLAFGTVQAYQITEVMRGINGSSYKATYTSYWAPEIGWNVKYDRKSSSGSRYKGEVTSVQ